MSGEGFSLSGVWDRFPGEVEEWRGKGKVRVIRSNRGKIVSWKKAEQA